MSTYQGGQGYQQPGYQQGYGGPPPQQGAPSGGCQYCGGPVQEDFSILGIVLAILFFPIGILCCIMMKEKKCMKCNAKL